MTNGDYKGAINDLTKSLKINPYHAIANYYLAESKYDIKDYEGAISDYKKSLDLRPKSFIYEKLARAQRKIKDYDGAINSYTKAIEVGIEVDKINEKSLSDLYTDRGSVQEEIRNFYEACKDWKRGAELGYVYERYTRNEYWCRDY